MGDRSLARVARGSAGTTAGGVVTAAAAFGSVAAVAGALGPAGAGVFGVGVALATILTQVGKLGTDTALVHALPRWGRDPGLRDGRARLLAGCLLLVGAVGVVAGAAAWWCADGLAGLLLDGAPAGSDAVRATAVGLPPAVVTAVALAGTRGLGSVRALVLNDQLAKPVLRLLGVVVVLAAGGGVVAVLAVWSAVAWVLLPWALRSLARDLGVVARPLARLDAGARSRFGRFAALRLASASVEVVGLNAGLLLVAALLGPTEAGFYTVALRLVLAGYLTLQAVRLAVAPQLSAALDVGDRRAAARLHHTSSGWVVLTAWPLYLVLVVLAPHVMAVFGPEFAGGADVLRVLAVGGLVCVAAGNVQTVVLMGGLAGSYLGIAVASVAVHVAVLALLAPALGGTGAAAGFVAATVVENGLAVLLVRRRLGVPPLGREVLVAAALVVATWGAGAGLAALVAPPTGSAGAGLVPVLAVLVLTAAVHAAACWRARAALALDHLLTRDRPGGETADSRPVPQETS